MIKLLTDRHLDEVELWELLRKGAAGHVKHFYSSDKRWCWTCTNKDNNLLGYMLYLETPNSFTLHTIHVTPEHRGGEYEKVMLDNLIKRVSKSNKPIVYFSDFSDTAMHAILKSMGFIGSEHTSERYIFTWSV